MKKQASCELRTDKTPQLYTINSQGRVTARVDTLANYTVAKILAHRKTSLCCSCN